MTGTVAPSRCREEASGRPRIHREVVDTTIRRGHPAHDVWQCLYSRTMGEAIAPTPGFGSRASSRVRELSARADARAVELSARPGAVLGGLLAVSVGLPLIGVPLGELVRDDPPAYFREGMPGTWLSFAILLAAAVVARAAFRREPGSPRWHASFWGLSAGIFALLAVVEIGQPTIYLGRWLETTVGAVAPFEIVNVDAALLIMLLAVVALVLARRALVLLHHPAAAVLLLVGAGLGVGSQVLDSFWKVSSAEFIAEESLKALAGPFVVAGYLVALRSIVRVHGSDPQRPEAS